MLNNLVRKENILGGPKVFVGDKYSDLVLESLGKIYIKYGNSLNSFDNIIQEILQIDENKFIIVETEIDKNNLKFPGNGKFVYVKISQSLYITIDDTYLLLINIQSENQKYVKSTGDTMTGPLEIITPNKVSPLKVYSKSLINNLNAEYINSRNIGDLAKLKENESIYGSWIFKNKNISENEWIFKDDIRHFGNLITTGNLQTPYFLGGFGGYGWQLDSNTNTLTIDNIIVRKVLQVYEMVVNQIKATNGSLWISNSTTCENVYNIKFLYKEDLDNIDISNAAGKDALLNLLLPDTYYLITSKTFENFIINRDTNDFNNSEDIGIKIESTSISTASKLNSVSYQYVNYKYLIHVINPENILTLDSFTSTKLLYDENYLNNLNGFADLTLQYIYKKNYLIGNDQYIMASNFDKDFGFFIKPRDTDSIVKIKPFYKYFGILWKDGIENVSNDLFIIETNDKPTIKIGDILRCQKSVNNLIKYYDCLVVNQITTDKFIVQKASSILDNYSEINYNDTGYINNITEKENDFIYHKNLKSYNQNSGDFVVTSENYEKLGQIQPKDDLIQMGNIIDINRQHAIYLTSTDDRSPYIDVLSGINRPDYSVLYDEVDFKKIKVAIKRKGDIYIRGEFDDYYYQKGNAITIEPKLSQIPVNVKNPIVYIESNEEQKDIRESQFTVYVNNGELNELPKDTSKGYFITTYPTELSIKSDKIINKTLLKARLGNLSGIYDDNFGKKQPYGYGLYSQNVFLTGEFYLNNGNSVVDFSKDQILLEFKNAGLSIFEQDGKSNIKLKADNIFLELNTGETIKFFHDNKVDGALLDIQGSIKAYGLNINDKFIVNPDGSFTATEALIKGEIFANKGKIGGFTITDRLIGSGDNRMWLSPDGIQFRSESKNIGIGDTLPAVTGVSDIISAIITTDLKQNLGHINTASVIITTKGGTHAINADHEHPDSPRQVALKLETESDYDDVALAFKGKLRNLRTGKCGKSVGLGIRDLWKPDEGRYRKADVIFDDGILTNIIWH